MANSLVTNLVTLYMFILIGFVLGRLLPQYRDKIVSVSTTIVISIVSPVQMFITMTTTSLALTVGLVVQIILVQVVSVLLLMGTTFWILKRKHHTNTIKENEVQNEMTQGETEIPKAAEESEESRIISQENKELGSYLLLNAYPNAMLYPLPIVLALFDPDLVLIVVIYSMSALFLRGTLAMYVSERLGANVKSSAWASVKRLLTFPPFLGIIISIIVVASGIPLPSDILLAAKPWVNNIASASGALLIGFILAGLAFQDLKRYAPKLKYVAIWRFAIPFGYFLSLAFFLHFPESQTEIRTILLLLVCGPPAVFNVAFAVYFKLEKDFAAVAVATLTMVALGLMPLIIFFGLSVF